MRILMVNKFLFPHGGCETYTFQLTEYLERMGHEVAFFGMDHPKNQVVPLDCVKNMDFHTRSWKRIFYPFKVVYSVEARKKFGKAIAAYRPDIVHVNNYHYQLTPSILYECFRHKVPVVQTLHDAILICPNYMLFRIDRMRTCENCRGGRYYHCLLNRCIHGSFAKSALGAAGGYLYHILNPYRKISKIIVPSAFLAEKMKEMGYRGNNLHVLHNFIVPNHHPITSEKEPYVLYFGRLSKVKGLETLVKAANNLPHIRFVIAGRGPAEEELRAMSGQNIEYSGFITGEALNTLIRKALFSVCPSVWYENCPMSVLESQALGTPVIGADSGGIPELIRHQVDGLLFEPGNVQDLQEKIDLLYSDKAMQESLSANCLQKVDLFSIDRYYENLMEIYRQCMGLKDTKQEEMLAVRSNMAGNG